MPNAFDASGARDIKSSTLAATPTASTSSVSFATANQGTVNLGKAIGNLSDMFDRMALPYDQAEGAKAVTRDEDGNVQIKNRFAFTANDTAYNNSAIQAGMAAARNDLEEGMQALRIQFDGDPQGFQKAADTYIRKLSKNPDKLISESIRQDAERIGSQHYQSIIEKNYKQDTNAQYETLMYRRKRSAEELEALAVQGGVDTDEFKAKYTEYMQSGNALVGNSNFGFTKEQMDYEAEALDGKIKTNVAVSLTRDVLSRQGPDAARQFVTSHFDDPNLGMNARDRNSARNLAMAEINNVVKANSAERKILRDDTAILMKRFDAGEDIGQDEVQEILGRAAQVGDPVTARNIINKSVSAEAARNFRGVVTFNDAAGVVNGFKNDRLVRAVMAQESSGNPLAESNKGASGLMQIMPGTAREIARERGVTDLDGMSDDQVKDWLKKNPEKNVEFGAHFLDKNLKRFGGDTPAALVAYNAGPAVAEKWIAAGKDDSMLPAETIKYKEKIMGRLAMGVAPTGPIVANNRLVTGSTNCLDFAKQHLGWSEQNPSQRAALSQFIQKYTGKNVDPATTPWCAAYMNGVLAASGQGGTGSLRALDFLKYGSSTNQPSAGDIVVFDRGGGKGHVGFFEGFEEKNGKTYVRVLGGNQGNKVSSTLMPLEQVAGYRQPPAAGNGPEHALPVSYDTPDGGRQYAYADAASAVAMRNQAAGFLRQHFTSFEQSLKKGIVPSTEEVQGLIDLVAFTGDKKMIDRTRALLEANETGIKVSGLTPELQKKFLEELDQKEAQGVSIAMREQGDIIRAQSQASQKAWQEDPLQAAAKYGELKLADLDWGNPETIKARSGQAMQIAASKSIPDVLPFTKAEIGLLTSFIASSNGQDAQAVLTNVQANLQPEQFNNLMADKDMRKAITGLSQSDDPQKMGAAFSILNAEYNRNPGQFSENYGSRTEANLFLWQDKRQFMTPDAMIKEMRRADDPSEKARQEMRQKEAGELTKKMSVNDAVKAIDNSWFFGAGAPTEVSVEGRAKDFSGALTTEYKRHFEAAFVETGNAETAKRLAGERLKKVWGPSKVNGNEVMRRAPELYYPPVNGSHDYIKEQLDRDVKAAIIERFDKPKDTKAAPLGEGIVYTEYGADFSVAEKGPPVKTKVQKVDQKTDKSDRTFSTMLSAPKKIVADHITEQELAAGKPPSYAIVVRYSDGTLDTLLDKEGRPLRFAADDQSAIAENTAKLEAEQIQRNQQRADSERMFGSSAVKSFSESDFMQSIKTASEGL